MMIHRPINFSYFNPCLPFSSSTLCSVATLQPQSKSFCERLQLFYKLTSVTPTHVPLCSKNGVFEEFTDALVANEVENEELDGLELLNKPYQRQVANGSIEETVDVDEVKKVDEEEVLEPFYKFFRPPEEESSSKESGETENPPDEKEEELRVEYYEPKPGDFVVGVVVSGNDNKLDVNVGADMLGTMLTKEVLPLYDKEMDHLSCDVARDAEEFMSRGKVGIVRNDEAIGGEKLPGKPVVEIGTVVFAEVLGRTLGGRPLLSTRRLFRRVAWHRVRQIKQLNEPIEVKITEWNTGGLLTRIEGLRAFLPKAELMNRVDNFTELKENVGRRMHVQITRINDATNDLILSEKEAWGMLHLRPGTLLDGTVKKIFPYGAQIRIGDTNRSGLLHISNITHRKITSVGDILSVGEAVKVVVVKSMFPDKISLSTAELESEPGLLMSDKERVFSEAQVMANKYRKKISIVSANRKLEAIPMEEIPFQDEDKFCSNWKWFQFQRD